MISTSPTDRDAATDLASFDPQSGSLLERMLFNHRLIVVLLCAIVTGLLGYQASKLRLNASFEKTIPTGHPYIANYLKYQKELSGLGNAVRIVVENPAGSIYDRRYLDTLAKINDEVFLLPGVERPFMKSLWTPNTRWTGVTEEGLEGGPVIPEDYDGETASLHKLETNIARSGEIGQTVALDARSSVIYVPLSAVDAQGQPLDYRVLSAALEKIRAKYEVQGVRIHVTGFAKIVGDLIDGLRQVLLFFGVAIAIAAAMVYWFTRCARSTVLVVVSSLIAVVWQLGLLPTLGYALDPYSMLVPFLIFAIGMSHGAQKMNGIMQDIGRGAHKLVAARFTFRRLFLAGLTALLADAVGFAVLMSIDIPVIRDLALTASIGVAVLIVTNLLLLPVLLSYVGVSPAAVKRTVAGDGQQQGGGTHLWRALERFTEPRIARITVLAALALAVAGALVGLRLQIGDLDPGAPELRAESRYNRDNAYITSHYSLSSDQFAVMVKTAPEGCLKFAALVEADRLGWALRQVPGVQSTVSLPDVVR
jgi:predicted RND superfamily exporter protein